MGGHVGGSTTRSDRGAALLDDAGRRRPTGAGGAVDGLGPPLLPVHPHQAELVGPAGIASSTVPDCADEALRADAVGGLAAVEPAGEGAQAGEDGDRHAEEGEPLAGEADVGEGEDGGDGGADGERGEEERSRRGHLADGEDGTRRRARSSARSRARPCPFPPRLGRRCGRNGRPARRFPRRCPQAGSAKASSATSVVYSVARSVPTGRSTRRIAPLSATHRRAGADDELARSRRRDEAAHVGARHLVVLDGEVVVSAASVSWSTSSSTAASSNTPVGGGVAELLAAPALVVAGRVGAGMVSTVDGDRGVGGAVGVDAVEAAVGRALGDGRPCGSAVS